MWVSCQTGATTTTAAAIRSMQPAVNACVNLIKARQMQTHVR